MSKIVYTNTDFEIVRSAICNGFFSGISVDIMIEALAIAETAQEFDDAVSGSILLSETIKKEKTK